MISSNATEATVDYFFMVFIQNNPCFISLRIMCDHDRATMNVVQRRCPESQLLLCWWHVPHAWQQHFCVAHYPELWAELKRWFRIQDPDEFLACWARIQELAPQSVIDYLVKTWLGEKELWSGVYRQNRTVYDLGDTNMLVEAWHHVLKSKHLRGKRGRRIDNLINTLINIAIPHYIAGHRAQEFGFQGPNLEVRARLKIKAKGELILPEDIQEVEAGNIFEVRSQTDRSRSYTVNIEANTCSPCPSFPTISYCKHICAVHNNFPGVVEHQSHSAAPAATPRPSNLNPPASPTSQQSHDHLLLGYIVHKLQHLQRANVVPSAALTDSLRTLDSSLNAVVGDQLLLPPKKNVAPNLHSWTETAAAMGVGKVIGATKKGAKKRTHTDAHAGGQGSGKQAKPDARV
ncbi:hypothetical protein C8R46DRAFT_963375, partial [Mycena filopes]